MSPIRRLEPFVPSGPDFDLAKRFFADLGFETDWDAGGLVRLRLGEGAFLLQDFHSQEMQENFMLQVAVDDLDAWWKRIRESGVLDRYEGVRANEPQDYPWGNREVHLIDPAGVCWHFLQARS